MENLTEEHFETLKERKISPPERQKRMDTLANLEQLRERVAPPRVDSPAGWKEFKESNPPGTEVLLKKGGVWGVYAVPEVAPSE